MTLSFGNWPSEGARIAICRPYALPTSVAIQAPNEESSMYGQCRLQYFEIRRLHGITVTLASPPGMRMSMLKE
jgi:hypothetical protein